MTSRSRTATRDPSAQDPATEPHQRPKQEAAPILTQYVTSSADAPEGFHALFPSGVNQFAYPAHCPKDGTPPTGYDPIGVQLAQKQTFGRANAYLACAIREWETLFPTIQQQIIGTLAVAELKSALSVVARGRIALEETTILERLAQLEKLQVGILDGLVKRASVIQAYTIGGGELAQVVEQQLKVESVGFHPLVLDAVKAFKPKQKATEPQLQHSEGGAKDFRRHGRGPSRRGERHSSGASSASQKN